MTRPTEGQRGRVVLCSFVELLIANCLIDNNLTVEHLPVESARLLVYDLTREVFYSQLP